MILKLPLKSAGISDSIIRFVPATMDSKRRVILLNSKLVSGFSNFLLKESGRFFGTNLSKIVIWPPGFRTLSHSLMHAMGLGITARIK